MSLSSATLDMRVDPSDPPNVGGIRTFFKVGILISMTFPVLIYVMQTFFPAWAPWQPFLFLVTGIGIISGTHVFATAYLYAQPANFVGVRHKYIVLYLVPLMLVALNLYAFTSMGKQAFFWFVAVYAFYALFHFSRQNIGILAFVTLSSASRPISSLEKLILNGVVACGMLAAPKVIEAGLFIIEPDKYADQVQACAPAFNALYHAGKYIYSVILLVATWNIVKNYRSYNRFTLTIFILCVVWYLPLYVLLKYTLLSFSLFTTAHGLQYLVVLGAQVWGRCDRSWREAGSAGKSQVAGGWGAAAPLITFLLVIFAAYYLWSNAQTIFSSNEATWVALLGAGAVAKLGMGLVAGLSLGHYWVDQFIWRFKSSERRVWLMENFAFLSPSHK